MRFEDIEVVFSVGDRIGVNVKTITVTTDEPGMCMRSSGRRHAGLRRVFAGKGESSTAEPAMRRAATERGRPPGQDAGDQRSPGAAAPRRAVGSHAHREARPGDPRRFSFSRAAAGRGGGAKGRGPAGPARPHSERSDVGQPTKRHEWTRKSSSVGAQTCCAVVRPQIDLVTAGTEFEGGHGAGCIPLCTRPKSLCALCLNSVALVAPPPRQIVCG